MDFADYSIFFTACLTLLIVPSVLIRDLSGRNMIASAIILITGYFQFYIFMVSIEEIIRYPHFFFSLVPVSVCFGFLVYYYIQTVVLEEDFSFKKNWPVTIPFFILIMTLPLYIYHTTVKEGEIIVSITGSALAEEVRKSSFQYNWKNGVISSYFLNRSNTVLSSVQVLSLSYILLFFVLSLRNVKRRLDFSGGRYRDFMFVMTLLGFSITANLAGILSVLYFNFYLLKLTGVLIGIVIILIYFLLQGFPVLFQTGSSELNRPGQQRIFTENADLVTLEEKMRRILKSEKLFCDEDLSLTRLSSALKVKPHFLSRYINETYHMNFNNFINRYRVDEAKKVLLDEPERNALSVALSVGFNSYSAFHTAFKKNTGLSPASYRKKNQM
jgi:AraC-like DNA-binding protein